MSAAIPASVSTVWLTIREAAEHGRVNPITLRRAVARGHLKAFRVNGRKHIRFRLVDLEQWLCAAPVPPTKGAMR
jgi:excisionase family DNA binding protein